MICTLSWENHFSSSVCLDLILILAILTFPSPKNTFVYPVLVLAHASFLSKLICSQWIQRLSLSIKMLSLIFIHSVSNGSGAMERAIMSLSSPPAYTYIAMYFYQGLSRIINFQIWLIPILFDNFMRLFMSNLSNPSFSRL